MAVDIFKRFATDEAKEVEGVDIDCGDGMMLKIARRGNIRYDRMMLEELEANQQALDTLPLEERDKLTSEIDLRILANTILVGWSGVKYKGKNLPYSVENSIKVLRHREFKKLVLQHSINLSNYLMASEEADEKN